jgi:hypothetical protein
MPFIPGWQSKFTWLIVVCPFVLFLLAIVLSVLLPYTDSDCPFGFFKLFLIDVFKRYANIPFVICL